MRPYSAQAVPITYVLPFCSLDIKQATKMMLPVIVNGRGNDVEVFKELVNTLSVLLYTVGTQLALELEQQPEGQSDRQEPQKTTIPDKQTMHSAVDREELQIRQEF